MGEFLRRGPLETIAAARGATVSVLPPCARHVLRGREAAIVRAGKILGFSLPRQACRSASDRDLAVLWLGPDEWLLLADDGGFAAKLEAGLGELPHALVDVGHRHAAIEVDGPGGAALLNAGCPLDLDPAEFPVGACTRSVFGKVEIILWRTGDLRFRVEVSRSVAAYVWRFLEEAREP